MILVGVGFAISKMRVPLFEFLQLLSEIPWWQIVVRVVDIRFGQAMRETRDVEHGTGAIQRLGCQKEPAQSIIVCRDPILDMLDVLVEWTPADDRWMRVVALYRLQPLGCIRDRGSATSSEGDAALKAPVTKLSPHEIAQPVCVVQEALFKDLLVKPCSIEARSKTEFYVALECLVAGSGQNAIRIVALVEDETLENDRAVYLDGLALDHHAAQPRIAGEGIHDRAIGCDQSNLQIVEMRILWGPEATAIRWDVQV